MKLAWLALAACTPGSPGTRPVTPTPTMIAPMSKLAFMRGVWMGPVEGVAPDGVRFKEQLAARVGPLLGGDIEVLESRGFDADGSTGFNTLEIFSYDPRTQKYELRSYVKDIALTSEITLTADGFTYELPLGAGAVERTTIAVKAGHWHEKGELIEPDKPPAWSYELDLTRTGDSDWPLGTPVAP